MRKPLDLLISSFGNPVKRLTRRLRGSHGASRGSMLIEAVIAILVLTTVGGAALSGLSTVQRSGASIQVQAQADSLARKQMEFVFSLQYQDPPAVYPPISAPAGYSVAANAVQFQAGDPKVQRVVVTVSRDGKAVLVVESLRLKD